MRDSVLKVFGEQIKYHKLELSGELASYQKI